MQILTEEEGRNWLISNGLPIGFDELRFLHGTYVAYELPNPAQISVQIELANGFVSAMKEISSRTADQGVFWITHRDGLYDYSDFDAYRKSLNEGRVLEKAPFHLFGQSDLVVLRKLLDFTFNLGLFAYVISPDKETVIYINEEWFIDVSCKNEKDYKFYKELFEKLKLKEIKNK